MSLLRKTTDRRPRCAMIAGFARSGAEHLHSPKPGKCDSGQILLRHNGCSTMLLTITNTKPPATDMGYLLHKNPSRVQLFELSFGRAHVFYPEATSNRCTA